MRPSHFAIAVAAAALTISSAALAGVPLKGVDVKLGKNPGGGVASRTTGPDGVADFGQMPAGSYTVTVQAPKPAPLHLSITGASSGAIERTLPASAANARQAPIVVSLDGRQPLRVVVTTP